MAYLKSWETEILKSIVNAKMPVPVKEFKVYQRMGNNSAHTDLVVELREKKFSFTLIWGQSKMRIYRTPAQHKIKDFIEINHPLTLETIIKEVKSWLDFVRRELLAESIWNQILNGEERIEDEFFTSTAKFSEEDKPILRERLKELESNLINVPALLDSHKEFIAQEFKDLESKIDSFSKKDFYLILVGIVTNWIFSGGMNVEQASLAWEYIKVFFRAYYAIQLQ